MSCPDVPLVNELNQSTLLSTLHDSTGISQPWNNALLTCNEKYIAQLNTVIEQGGLVTKGLWAHNGNLIIKNSISSVCFDFFLNPMIPSVCFNFSESNDPIMSQFQTPRQLWDFYWTKEGFWPDFADFKHDYTQELYRLYSFFISKCPRTGTFHSVCNFAHMTTAQLSSCLQNCV